MEWINVKDRMPEKNQWVIATDGEGMGSFQYEEWNGFENGFYIDAIPGYDGFRSNRITHWMPLLTLPEGPK
jgi:hypothetical protein